MAFTGAVDPTVLRAAKAKLDRGLPLDRDERLTLNFDLASKAASEILEKLDESRQQNGRVVRFTQGDFNASRLAVKLLATSMFALAAAQSDKRQKLELDVSKLWKRLIDLEEGATGAVRGTWNRADTYRKRDQVTLNGATFTAKRDDPGPCPGDGWQLTAAQGKRGKPGPRVQSLTVDGQGMLTLTNSDGSTVKCDLYPVLAKVQQGAAR